MFRQRYVNAATVIVCVVVAIAPPVGFMRFLDSHVVDGAERILNDYAERMVGRIDATVREGTSVLSRLYQAGAADCDVRGREAMRRAVADSQFIQEVVIYQAGDNVRCGSSLVDTRHQLISAVSPVNATIGLFVSRDEQDRRVLTVRFQPTEHEVLVARFLSASLALDMLPQGWREEGRAFLALDDQTVFEEVSPDPGLWSAAGGAAISARLVSQRYPVIAVIEVAKSAVMKDYNALRVYTFAVMALFAALVMTIALVVARRHNRLSDDIALGLRRGEFIPYYQPVLSLSSGRLVGCEVLVRRQRSDGSIDVPGRFIAQAELDGQIVRMTQQLMRLVIDDVGEHYKQRPQLTVGFNLCARHFRDESVIDEVRRIFGRGLISFDQLVFEVTERFPLTDMSKAKTIIAKLQGLGSRVALDDAGTGHSGLAALHRLGMDIVKIDKIFVDGIGPATTQAPIVDSLVDLAKSYGMSVVAEGVEEMDQLRYLRAKGVDAAQGYLFAPPLPASSYIRLIDAMLPLPETDKAKAADAA